MNKPSIKITRHFEFEMAHYLPYYEGRCAHIHGHSYKMEITVTRDEGVQTDGPNRGMIIDFKKLNEIVTANILDKYDHSLTIQESTVFSRPLWEYCEECINRGGRVNYVNYTPTVENMCKNFFEILEPILMSENNIKLLNVKIYETSNSFGEYGY